MWSPLIQQTGWGHAFSTKAAEQEEKEHGQHSSTKQVHYRYSGVSSITTQPRVDPWSCFFVAVCGHIILNCMKIPYSQRHAVIFVMHSSSIDIEDSLLIITVHFKLSKQSRIVKKKNQFSLLHASLSAPWNSKQKHQEIKEITWLVWANHFQT